MKQFLRNFKKQKTVGILNICGLSLGIMAALSVGLWAVNELTFDNFHVNGDRMYRVVQEFSLQGEEVKAATSFKPLGELVAAEIPEIEQMCRIYKERDGITIKNEVHFGLTAVMTDYSFFSFFSFPMKEADPKIVFSAPDNVILSESTAKKFFGEKDPIGEKISYHGHNFSVSGIMYDIPKNSHLQTDIVFPLFGYFGTWGWDSSFSYDTYFIVSDNANIASLEERISEINRIGMKVFPEREDGRSEVKLQPLKDIHLGSSGFTFDSAVKGDKKLLIVFIITAAAILIIACINFTNLFISTSFIRAKGIGIKKSQGAGKGLLIAEFYRETSVYVLISIALGLLFTILTLPVFNSYTGSHITVDFTSPRLYIFSFGLGIITIIMAGTFPAIQMTRFGIIETLSSKFRGKNMSVMQKGLIILQFVSSICLLIVVSFFGRQINQILTQDLGFENNNIIYVKGWRDFGSDYKSLRNSFANDPYISDVAVKQYDLPIRMGNGVGGMSVETGEKVLLDLSEVSPNYFDFFRMEFVAGENPLTLESAPEQRYCVLNERAVQMLGLSDPIDKSFVFVSIGNARSESNGQKFIVKGVVRDSYVKSLYQEPDAQMYLNLSRDDHNPIFFKVNGDPQRAIKSIEKKWKEKVTDAPFEYHFLNEAYENLYTSEVNTRNVLSYAMIITLVITIAGLYAMGFYSTQRRKKEVGIRKINGATITDLLLLLNKDILIGVSIAFVIACPVSWLYLRNWLSGFVVKTPLSLWIFILMGIIAGLTALITVSYQTWKAAAANPVDSIKNE